MRLLLFNGTGVILYPQSFDCTWFLLNNQRLKGHEIFFLKVAFVDMNAIILYGYE